MDRVSNLVGHKSRKLLQWMKNFNQLQIFCHHFSNETVSYANSPCEGQIQFSGYMTIISDSSNTSTKGIYNVELYKTMTYNIPAKTLTNDDTASTLSFHIAHRHCQLRKINFIKVHTQCLMTNIFSYLKIFVSVTFYNNPVLERLVATYSVHQQQNEFKKSIKEPPGCSAQKQELADFVRVLAFVQCMSLLSFTSRPHYFLSWDPISTRIAMLLWAILVSTSTGSWRSSLRRLVGVCLICSVFVLHTYLLLLQLFIWLMYAK